MSLALFYHFTFALLPQNGWKPDLSMATWKKNPARREALEQHLRGAGVAVRRYPTSKGREDPSKTVGGVRSHLESSPIPARDAQRAETNLVCTRTQRPHKDRDRTVFGCLLRRCESAVDCCGGRGSGGRRPGCGISPLGRGRH